MIDFISERKVFSPETGHGALISCIESGKTSVEQTINPIEALKEINHPRKDVLLEWINLSDENRKWYLQNTGKRVDLVTDGIMLLGDEFELEDEETEEDGKGILKNSGNTFFSWESAKKHAESIGKEMVFDWGKYIDFLPGDDKNKMFFLQKVLGLKLSGFGSWFIFVERGNIPNIFKRKTTAGFYWGLKSGKDEANHLAFDKDGIIVSNINKKFFYRLRCLKKKQAK